MAALAGGGLNANNPAVLATGAVASTVFITAMLQSVGQTMERWKKAYTPNMMEQITTIQNSYAPLVVSGLQTADDSAFFFGVEPLLNEDGKPLGGAAPTWTPTPGAVMWDHARWMRMLHANSPWHTRIMTLILRICHWQFKRMQGLSLDMFRFVKSKRANDPLNLLCEEMKTWLVAVHSKSELQLVRHLEQRIQFLVALRVQESCGKTMAASKNINPGSRGIELVFEHTTAQLLIELEYRLHNWLADVFHKINRAGIGMCFDMLTCRMRITYEQLVLYLFYLLNAEKHGLVPGDTLKAVTKLQSASDLEQNREALSLALIRKTQPQPACAAAGHCLAPDGHGFSSSACLPLNNQRVRLLCHLVRMPEHLVLGAPAPTTGDKNLVSTMNRHKQETDIKAAKKAARPHTDQELAEAKLHAQAESFLIARDPAIPASLAIGGDRTAIGMYFMYKPPKPEPPKNMNAVERSLYAARAAIKDIGAPGGGAPFNRPGLPLTMMQPPAHESGLDGLGWLKMPRSSRGYKRPPSSLADVCMTLLPEQLRCAPVNSHHIIARFIEAHGFLLLLRRSSIILDGLNAMGKENIFSLMNKSFVTFLHCAKRACMHLLSSCEQLQLDVTRLFGSLFSDRACNDQLWRTEFENWRANWGHANSLWSAQAANRAEPLHAGDLRQGMADKDPETTKSIEAGDGIAENLRVMITQLDEVAQFASKDQAEELALHGKRAALTAESLKAFVAHVQADVLAKPMAPPAAALAAPVGPVPPTDSDWRVLKPCSMLVVRPGVMGVKVKPRTFVLLSAANPSDWELMQSQMSSSKNKYYSGEKWAKQQAEMQASGAMYMLVDTSTEKAGGKFMLLGRTDFISWTFHMHGNVQPKVDKNKAAIDKANKDAIEKAAAEKAAAEGQAGAAEGSAGTPTPPASPPARQAESAAFSEFPPSHLKALRDLGGSSSSSSSSSAPNMNLSMFTLTCCLADPNYKTVLNQSETWFMAADSDRIMPALSRIFAHIETKQGGGKDAPAANSPASSSGSTGSTNAGTYAAMSTNGSTM